MEAGTPDLAKDDVRFLQTLLRDLRDEHFYPRAWRNFLARSWERSVNDARAYPALVWSTVVSTVGLALVSAVWLALASMVATRSQVVIMLVVAGCGLVLQQGFVWLHLGMVEPLHGGPHLQRIGVANNLTLVRMLAGWLLLAVAVSGIASRSLLLSIFLMGALVDGIDGSVARIFEQPTRLGRMLDAIADALLFCVGATVFADQEIIPLWFAVIVYLRFLAPLIWAIVSYFFALRPVRYEPTPWGKLAGAALTAAFFTAGVRGQGVKSWQGGAQLFLVVVAALMVTASAVQLWSEHQRWSGKSG